MKLISNQNSKNSLLVLTALLLSPCMLIAHPGDGEIHTLSDGIQHFFSGWDHILLSALAGIVIASKHKLYSIQTFGAAIGIPLLLTFIHQSFLLPTYSQSIASLGLFVASVILIILGSLAPKLFTNVSMQLTHQWRRIGIGFALLALALFQL